MTRNVKLVDTAASLYKSTDFDYILTRTLSEDVNSQLNKNYGEDVSVEFLKPGAFYVNIENSTHDKNMPELEQEVYEIVLNRYGEAYKRAKQYLATLEGVEVE